MPPSEGSVPALLSDTDVDARLKKLRGWKREGAFISKKFEYHEFMDGIAFVRAIAKIAEKEEHHPDISIRYTTITLSIQTHSEGGVTDWDLDLAERIEAYLKKTKRA
jgi:4a-hydroxytetrahydrobiopterin dehydratase